MRATAHEGESCRRCDRGNGLAEAKGAGGRRRGRRAAAEDEEGEEGAARRQQQRQRQRRGGAGAAGPRSGLTPGTQLRDPAGDWIQEDVCIHQPESNNISDSQV